MASVLYDIARFLTLSSVQFAAIAAVALLALNVTRASGRAALRTLELVAALPLLSLLAEQLPERPVRVLPASFPAAIGIERDIALPPASAGAVAKADASRASLDKAMVPPGGANRAPHATAAPVPSGSIPAPAPAPPPHRSRIDLPAILGLPWLAVVAVLIVRIVRQWLALRTVLHSAVPVRGPEACVLVEECVRKAGLARRPRVLVSAACGVPFVAGLRKPCIVMPSRLAGERLRLALLHEMAHVRYRDHLWIVPELAVRTLYFFHPLVHRVLNRIHEEREHRCDRLVTRLFGRRAPYAEFLLDEVRRARERPREFAVLALRGDRNAVARRVGRILEGGEQTMKKTISERLAAGAVVLWLVLVLSCGATNVAVGQEGAAPAAGAPDHINASKTDTPGLYHVLPVFEKLTEVSVIKRGGPYGKEHEIVLAQGEGYAFDPATGNLKVARPIDDEKQMIVVQGVRKMPWEWQAGEPLKAGSVRVLLGDREGKRGVDFDVDEAKGRIRFLKPDLCDREKPYFISYDIPDDPKRPNTSRCGSIGNHPDRAAVRRFLGIGETPASPEDLSKSIGTNASPTDDARLWTIVQPMETGSIRVAVAKRDAPGQLKWLERSTDFVYDESATTIAFLRDMPIDKEAEFLFVQGIPRDRRVFFAHRVLKEGDVSVTVDGRVLVAGTGFSVDYKTGKITVHDEAITKPGTKFRVDTTGWTYGN
jgi:beta-lactamase regulating signal transducer with metallopeptidase domain